MYDIFSTREIAMTVWFTVLFTYCIISPKIRKSALGVVKSACTPKLSIPFICMLIYAAFFVLLLTLIPFWKWVYIKDIAVWLLFAGIPACYMAIGKNIDENYFHDMFFDNVKFIVLVEFITGTFTFHLIVELLLIPAIAFLAMFDALAGGKPEYSSAKKLTSFLMFLTGLSIVIFSFREAVNTYQMFGMIDLLVSFFVPIVFSALYIPVAYIFAMYAKYEMLFIRMSFKSSHEQKIRRRQKLAVFCACGLSYKLVASFEKEYVKNMYVSMKRTEFDDLIKAFKRESKNNM